MGRSVRHLVTVLLSTLVLFGLWVAGNIIGVVVLVWIVIHSFTDGDSWLYRIAVVEMSLSLLLLMLLSMLLLC